MGLGPDQQGAELLQELVLPSASIPETADAAEGPGLLELRELCGTAEGQERDRDDLHKDGAQLAQ